MPGPYDRSIGTFACRHHGQHVVAGRLDRSVHGVNSGLARGVALLRVAVTQRFRLQRRYGVAQPLSLSSGHSDEVEGDHLGQEFHHRLLTLRGMDIVVLRE